jgi:hypothetical protein
MSAARIVELYRTVLLRAWPGALLLAAVTSIFLDRLQAALPDPLAPDALEQFSALLGSASLWRALLAVGLFSLWPSCALVLCAHSKARGAPLPALGGLPAALRAYAAILVVSVVFAALVAAGALLFLVPGIYLAGALQLWVVALLAGDAPAWQALQASWRRVRGRWWQSNSMVAIILLCGLGAGTLLSVFAGAVAHALASAMHFDAASQRILALGVSMLGNFVAAPAYPVALVASYRDLERAPL